MTIDRIFVLAVAMMAVVLLTLSASTGAGSSSSHFGGLAGALTQGPNPPSEPVRLIFIHRSTGGNWLADPNEDQPYGSLGRALMNNNYFVSATNYGWGIPDLLLVCITLAGAMLLQRGWRRSGRSATPFYQSRPFFRFQHGMIQKGMLPSSQQLCTQAQSKTERSER